MVLTGGLGAGKTTFVRGLARGVGVLDPGEVKSPSYTLVLRYEGGGVAGGDPASAGRPGGLLHLDAYFMQGPEDLDLAGLDDALMAGDVAVVEWGERMIDELPRPRIRVRFEVTGEAEREIEIFREES